MAIMTAVKVVREDKYDELEEEARGKTQMEKGIPFHEGFKGSKTALGRKREVVKVTLNRNINLIMCIIERSHKLTSFKDALQVFIRIAL